MPFQASGVASDYDNVCPVFGNILSYDGLKLCVRASSPLNMYDLSGNEHPLTPLPGVVYSPEGIRVGDLRSVQTDLLDADDDFTMLLAAKPRIGAATLYSTYACGTYQGQSIGGIAIYFGSTTSVAYPGKRRVFVRGTMTRRNVSSGALTSKHALYYLQDNLDADPAELDPLYAVFRHSASLRTSELILPGLVQSVANVDDSSYSTTFANRNFGAPALYHRIGDAPVDSAGAQANSVTVAQYMYYGRRLSDLEYSRQYLVDKAWLLAARGLTV